MKQATTSQAKKLWYAVLAAFPALLFTILTETDDVTKPLLKFRNTPSLFTQNTCAMEKIITDLHNRFINKYQQDVTPQYFLFPVLSLSTCFGHVPCPSSGDQID
jgi:hypothetical protein